jgi:hypothetical protein
MTVAEAEPEIKADAQPAAALTAAAPDSSSEEPSGDSSST